MQLQVFLEITSYCGGSCPGCPVSGKMGVPEPLEQWKKWIDSCREHLGEIILTGGEPLLHPEVYVLFDFLDRQGIPFSILTNGCWPEPGRLLEMLGRCRNFRSIIFSLHGSHRMAHLKFTGNRSLEMARENMKAACSLGLTTCVSTVLGDYNKHQVKDLVRQSLKAGASRHIFSRYIGPMRNGISIYRPDLSRVTGMIKEMQAKGLPVGFTPCFPSCFVPESPACQAGRGFFVIGEHGALRPCAFTSWSFGSLREHSFLEIWHAKQAAHWRDAFSSTCPSCSLQGDSCHGACPVYTIDYHLPGDPLAPY